MYVTRMRGGPVEAQDFIDILNNGRFFNATNPRDHVYAFLGHPSATVASPRHCQGHHRKRQASVDDAVLR